MKIIQINGWLGRLNAPLVRFIEKESPEIVCLQEAFRPMDKDLPTFHDQYGFVDEIQQKAGIPNLYFAPAWGFEMAGIVMDVGNAILSKLPLLDEHELHVNNNYYVAKSASDYQRNTRVFQSASIQVDNYRKITIANHQGYLAGAHASGDTVSVSMMEKVSKALSTLPRPLIFCGDLNVGPNTPTIAALHSSGLRNLTVESNVKTTLSPVHRAPEPDRSSVVCDYILVSSDISVEKFYVSDEVVSDHKALILDFNI